MKFNLGLADQPNQASSATVQPTYVNTGTSNSLNGWGQSGFNPLPTQGTLGAQTVQQQPSGGGSTSRVDQLSAIKNSGGGLNPSQQSEFDALIAQMNGAAQSQTDAELQAANVEFDRNRENLEAQQGFLGEQRSNTLSSLGSEFGNIKNQAETQRTNAKTNTEQQQQDALQTAQDVQRKSRNSLRALGILNSSAAGEMLQKPFNQYDQQRARMNTALTQRFTELDDFLNAQADKHASAVREVETNYTNLIGNIQRDLRFNDRSRAAAVQQANASLKNTLAQISSSIMNYKMQVDTAKSNAQQAVQSISSYNNPDSQANLGAIQGAGFNGQPAKTSETAAIVQDPKKKSVLSDTIGQMYGNNLFNNGQP